MNMKSARDIGLFFVAACSTVAAFGQGTAEFANWNPILGVNAPFFDAKGEPLVGTNCLAQLYAGKMADALIAVGTAVAFMINGYIDTNPFESTTVIIPGIGPGNAAYLQMRAWESAGGPTFESAASSGHWTGVSSVVYVTLGGHLGGVPAPPAPLTGLTYPGPPMIIQEPVNAPARVGGNATLSVIASGGGPMGFQWYQGQAGGTNAPVVGATNSAFTAVNLATNASFWVRVADSAGTTNSAAATVWVYPTNAFWLDAQMTSNGASLTLDGIVGTAYRIDYSPGPGGTNWTTLTNITLPTSLFTLRDAGTTNSASRFYRAVAP
jgi:hypothetical protein